MSRLRTQAIALLAAATVAVGSLAVPAPASAMPMSCNVRNQLSRIYAATAEVFHALGDERNAQLWWAQAWALIDGC